CTAWTLQAMASAKTFSMEARPEAVQQGLGWLASITARDTGRPGFRKRGEPLTLPLPPGDDGFRAEMNELLTAAALSSRQALQESPLDPALVKEALGTILRSPARWDRKPGSVDFMYWYFAAR